MSDMTQDMTVKPELLGLQTNLMPFLQFTSTQRGTMFSSNIQQAVITDHVEFPKISTGWEEMIGRYETGDASFAMPEDASILTVIPKFRTYQGEWQVKVNPTVTVIYHDDNNTVGCFDVSDYTKLQSGFGYVNKKLPAYHRISTGQRLDKGDKFVTSPAHNGSLYNLGLNVNTAFIPHWHAVKDAFVMSRSLQRRLAHDAIDTIQISIPRNMLPLNTYGDGMEYRIMPDIGETVRGDCLLMALRELSDISFLSDMTPEAVQTPQHLHDHVFRVPEHATVTDIDVFMDSSTYQMLSKSHETANAFDQVLKYQNHHYWYWDELIRIHQSLDEGVQLTPEFNNMVTRAYAMHPRSRHIPKEMRHQLRLSTYEGPLDQVIIKVTYMFKRYASLGFKLAGREGGGI